MYQWSDREILLEAIDIIGGYSEKVGADTPTGYKIVQSYPKLVEDLKDFMKEVGYFHEEDW